MKRIIAYFVFVGFLFSSCEDVIDVTTPNAPARLVVEGIIRADTEQPNIPVIIRISQSAGFFESTSAVSDLESIEIVIDYYQDGEQIATETKPLSLLNPATGLYGIPPGAPAGEQISTDILNEDVVFNLIIRRNGLTYLAESRYFPSTPIQSIRLGTNDLFGDDETEVVVRYTDRPEPDNYYVFNFGFGNFLVTEDTFYEGQEFEFSYFYDQTFEAGTELEISIFGADLQLYNYMDLVIQQAEGDVGPFQTPKATVRGNIYQADEDFPDLRTQNENTPFGYFAVVQEYESVFVIPAE